MRIYVLATSVEEPLNMSPFKDQLIEYDHKVVVIDERDSKFRN
jgi:hypothetical protein